MRLRSVSVGTLLVLVGCGPERASLTNAGSESADTSSSGTETVSSESTGSDASTDVGTESDSDSESIGTQSGSESETGGPDLPTEPLCETLESNLPLVIIDTGGQFIPDEPKIDADLTIIDNGPGQTNCIGHPPAMQLAIGIETRGSTSQMYPKKSFGVETRDELGADEKVSIFGMPQDSDWVLYAPYPDKTLIRNTLTFDLHRQMGHYSSRSRHVEVVLNGEYWGVYEWLEKIDRSPGRVAVSDIDPIDTAGDALTGGYIWKVDKLTGEVGYSWVSLYSNEVTFQVHYPRIDDITPEQQQYARGIVNGFEAMLSSPQFADPQSGYPAWIDVQSFMDFMILQELGRTIDGYRSSSFFYKDRDSVDPRLKAGPMWDFNLSYGNCDYCDAFSTTGYQYDFDIVCGEFFDVEIPFWWKRLLEDPAFANALRCRWEQLRDGPLADQAIAAFIAAKAEELADAQVRNFERWPILGQYVEWNPFVGQTYEEELAYMQDWIAERSLWLDDNFAGVCP
jgi:hypothetical protein